MDRSHSQQVALAVVPKVMGSLSFVFSTCIAVAILRDSKRRKFAYHRLLLGISIVDMSASLWMFLSTWPIPEGEALYAVGNTATCTTQGFFLQFGISAPFYNASLSIYYFLVIVRQWNESDIRHIEWLLHGFPLAWASVSAVTGLALNVYQNAGLWCWVGSQYRVFRWTAYYGPLWCMIAIATACCIAIYQHVRQFAIKESVRLSTGTADNSGINQRRSSRQLEIIHSQQFQQQLSHELSAELSLDSDKGEDCTGHTTPQQQGGEHRRMVVPATFAVQLQRNRDIHRQERRLREIAHQCFWYAAAFYINFAALSTIRLWQAIDPDSDIYYPLLLLAAFTVPMQGLPNFLIYARPKVRKMARQAWVRYFCGCCGGGGMDGSTPPWWYRLAQSLSERNNRDGVDNGPRQGTGGRNASSTAVVHFNPGVVNEKPKNNLGMEQLAPHTEGDVVLVVVDTPNEGRQWRIEGNDNKQPRHRHQQQQQQQRHEQEPDLPTALENVEHTEEQDLKDSSWSSGSSEKPT